MKKADIISGLIGMIISIFVFYESSKFPVDVVMSIGPSYFPRMLATALLIVSGILIINAIIGRSKKTSAKFNIKDPGVQRAGISLIATIIYCIILRRVGFIISSIIYLTFLMYLLKKRDYTKMVTISIGVTIAIYFVFKKLLNITLPTGFFGL